MKLKQFVKSLSLRYKIYIYGRRREAIFRKVSSKKTINVVFFVLYESMWKCDGLYNLLEQSEKFVPFIISTPYPNHPIQFSKDNQEKLEVFFLKKGYRFVKGYDFENNCWFDVKSINPDIIFYQQPYNAGYSGFKIESFWDQSLFGYIPYCYDLEKTPVFYNNLLQNIAWKVFLPTLYEKEIEGQILLNGGINLVATGYPLADKLISKDKCDLSIWKNNDCALKRVIWAPHHSILENDPLNYSNFLRIADEMYELAIHYKDKIQFAFKPHPVLKRKLYKLDSWGVNRTNDYYKKWNEAPNCTLVEGDYIDYFLSSHGMIHDSASFTAEYLYTLKPVMYIAKKGHKKFLNDFGIMCYDKHYKGSTINEIKEFLDDVIINGNDIMYSERESFLRKYLMPLNGKSVAQNMYDVFSSDFLAE